MAAALGLVARGRALRRRARAARAGALPGPERLRTPTCDRRRCWARSSCSACPPRPSPSRWPRSGAWSPSRSASSGAPRPPGRAGCGGGSCCRWPAWPSLLPRRRDQNRAAARGRDHRAAGRRRRAAAVGRRARRRAARRGRGRVAARGPPPAARPRRRVARRQRDRGRRRGGDRAPDGLHRRAGASTSARPAPTRVAHSSTSRATRRRESADEIAAAAGGASPACVGSRPRPSTPAARYVAACATLRELAAIRACAPGDTFATKATPGATLVKERKDPGGAYRDGVFATTARPGDEPLAVHAFVRADPDAFEASATPPPRSTRCSPSNRSSASPPTRSSTSCAARCSPARRS